MPLISVLGDEAGGFLQGWAQFGLPRKTMSTASLTRKQKKNADCYLNKNLSLNGMLITTMEIGSEIGCLLLLHSQIQFTAPTSCSPQPSYSNSKDQTSWPLWAHTQWMYNMVGGGGGFLRKMQKWEEVKRNNRTQVIPWGNWKADRLSRNSGGRRIQEERGG